MVVPRLMDRGVDVGVVCFGGASIAGEKVYSLSTTSKILYTRNGEPNSTDFASLLNDIRRLDKAGSEISMRENYDLVQIEEPVFGPFLSTKLPRIITVHNTQFGESKAMLRILQELGQTKRLFFSGTIGIFFDYLSLQRSTKIVAVSPTVKQELVGFYGVKASKVEVIPNGINFPLGILNKWRQKKKLTDYPFVCAYVGRLVDHKRVDVMLHALSILRRNGLSEFKAYIVGTGPKEESLRKLARQLSLDVNVEFTGFASEDRLREILEAADVFVFPSIYEGWGLAIYEAAAYGAAPLVTDIPVFLSSLSDGETALFFKHNDPEDLAKKLTLLVSDPVLLSKIQSQAKAATAKFGWDKSIDKLTEMYSSLVKPRPIAIVNS
jgi:glycosyltransferase involved in cell wall biosynthesis